MDDWDSLRVPLEAACEAPGDEDAVRRAVDAAELVASTAGEPPDELPAPARDWVETHGVPPDDLVELACRSMKTVANGINKLHQQDAERAILLVTHYQRLLNFVVPDFVHVMMDGRIVKSGGKQLAMELEAKGYDWIANGELQAA